MFEMTAFFSVIGSTIEFELTLVVTVERQAATRANEVLPVSQLDRSGCVGRDVVIAVNDLIAMFALLEDVLHNEISDAARRSVRHNITSRSANADPGSISDSSTYRAPGFCPTFISSNCVALG